LIQYATQDKTLANLYYKSLYKSDCHCDFVRYCSLSKNFTDAESTRTELIKLTVFKCLQFPHRERLFFGSFCCNVVRNLRIFLSDIKKKFVQTTTLKCRRSYLNAPCAELNATIKQQLANIEFGVDLTENYINEAQRLTAIKRLTINNSLSLPVAFVTSSAYNCETQ